MEQTKTKHLPASKVSMIAWVRDSLNKPPFPISPQQSLLQNKEPKQPAYYDGKYYKALEWKKFQNWGDFDLQLRTKLINTWHSDSKIEGISTIGGWNGTHWLGWIDFDLDDFGDKDKIDQENLTEIQTTTQLMDSEIANWIEQFPILKNAPHFTTPSGGHRFLIAWEKEPENFGANNGFTLNPNSEARMGELLTRNGGHTLLPPTVGVNGKAYEWVHFAEYPPVVESPESIGLYPAKAAKTTPQRPEREQPTPKSYQEFNNGWEAFLNGFTLPASEVIPLENCLSKEHRELIRTGVGEGARDNTAAALARDLIGTANYLTNLSQPFDGDPRRLLEQFCFNCSPPLLDNDVNRIYGSAERSNPSPCLPEEALKACIAGYIWRNGAKHEFIGKTEKQSPSSNAFRPIQFNNPQLVNYAHYNPRSNDDILKQIDKLIEEDFQGSALTAKLNELASHSIPTIQEIRTLYNQRLKEIDHEETREDTVKELDLLLKANQASIPLESVLPKELAEPINKLASWLNLRPESYLTALLTGISSLHHPDTKLILNSDWDFEVTPNLFAAIVAPSSQKKSPILKVMVTKPMRALHRQAKEDYQQKLAEYNEKIHRYDELKKSRKEEDKEALQAEFPKGKPSEPRQKIYYFTNATGEGIINQVQAHPDQGILYLKDELAGVFKSANQYRGGRGSDGEDLLSYYDGTGGTVLRASGVTADIDGLLLSVLGSVQPKVLQKLLGDGEDSNGNWARFMFVNQPLAPSEMSSDGGSFDINPLITSLYERIANLPPQTYRLQSDAFNLFCQAYNRLEQKRVSFDTSPSMSHVWGKCEGRIGKLAINLHRLKYVMAGQIPPGEIDRETIKAAISLTNFYALQVQSLYTSLDSDAGLASHLAKVLDVANRKGDWITARDVTFSLSSSQKKSIKADTIRQWFRELEVMGKGITEGTGNRIKFKTVTDCYQGGNKIGNSLNSSLDKDSSQSVTTVTDFSQKITLHDTTDSDLPQTIGLEDNTECKKKNLNFGNSGNSGNNYSESIDIQGVDTVTDPGNKTGNSSVTTESAPQVWDYQDVIETTDKELNRLGWTKEKGIQYLWDTYNKKSRQLLSDEELLEFSAYLQSLPTPYQNDFMNGC